MDPQRLYVNGISGATGDYLLPPLTVEEAAAVARGRPPEKGLIAWLKKLLPRPGKPLAALPDGIPEEDVAQAGWAVVFPKDTPDAVRQALRPLLIHRERQVQPGRFKVLEYERGQGRKDWLEKHGAHASDVNPDVVPYYVLLVGSPTAVPFEFQYLLDVDYAVGRLAFDTPEQYRQYAKSVVAYETAAAVPSGKEVVFWGPRHANDAATALSSDCLLAPLHDGLPPRPPVARERGYRARYFKEGAATHANLAEVLHARGGAAPPAVLFTASHGVGWAKGDARQRPAQGALLCQDWTGPGGVKPAHYLTAADVADDARVHGLVAFLFACFGAGTPAFDSFLERGQAAPAALAEEPFAAALPQRLLSHPRGAALAVVGHVDRAWGFSLQPPGLAPQVQPFRNFLGRVLRGDPVGHATRDFSQRFATMSAELLNEYDRTRPGQRPSDRDLVWNWVARNDAQSYVLLGDPAVHMRPDLLQEIAAASIILGSMKVWIGTSGYSYPDWVGPFYPEGTRSNRMLASYARQFPLVELNFTFYRPPTPEMLAKQAEQVPAGFQFLVKVPRSISHEERPTEMVLFRRGVEELRRRGCLLGLLCQLPQANHYGRQRLDWLDWLGRELADCRLAVEFRHRSWARPDLPGWLAERRIDLVAVDAPAVAQLYPSGLVQSTERVYVRLHSRNAGNWYLSDKERYDYHYDDAALGGWVEQVLRTAGRTREALLLFNNCHRGQAPDNARRMTSLFQNAAAGATVVAPFAAAPAQRGLFDGLG